MTLAGLRVVTLSAMEPTVVEFRGADGSLAGVIMNLAAINYRKNGRPLTGLHALTPAERAKRYRERKKAEKKGGE